MPAAQGAHTRSAYLEHSLTVYVPGPHTVQTLNTESWVPEHVWDTNVEPVNTKSASRHDRHNVSWVALHVRSVGKYLARWGFKPQKTVKGTARPSAAAAANTGVQRRRVAPRAEPLAVGVVVDAPPIP